VKATHSTRFASLTSITSWVYSKVIYFKKWANFGKWTLVEPKCENLPEAVIPETPHRESGAPNMPAGQRPSDMDPKGGRPWDGRRPPADRNTLLVFFRFFHFALLFWNQTCHHTNTQLNITSLKKQPSLSGTVFLNAVWNYESSRKLWL